MPTKEYAIMKATQRISEMIEDEFNVQLNSILEISTFFMYTIGRLVQEIARAIDANAPFTIIQHLTAEFSLYYAFYTRRVLLCLIGKDTFLISDYMECLQHMKEVEQNVKQKLKEHLQILFTPSSANEFCRLFEQACNI